MPPEELPRELEPVIKEFMIDQKAFAASAKGRAVVKEVAHFCRSLEQPGKPGLIDERGPAAVVGWITRLPKELITHEKAPLISLGDMPKKQALRALSAGMQVLTNGACALLENAEPPQELAPAALLYAAFGDLPAAAAIRKPMFDPDFSWPTPWNKELPDIAGLVRGGELWKLLETYLLCGNVAYQQRSALNRILPFGRVTGVVPVARACAGQQIRISYANFGASPLPRDQMADILVSLPTNTGGCEHISIIQDVAQDFLDQGRWTDSGSITVTLPDNVSSGYVGFFSVPPPAGDAGQCGPGSLIAAAGMYQSILGEQCGPGGVMLGETARRSATKVEAGRFMAAERACATPQPDNANHLNAGPPIIAYFRLDEPAPSRAGNVNPIYPGEFVTLSWSVSNFDHIEIIARDVAASENAHELPAIPGPLQAAGSIRIPVTCTRRWEAQYVLRASNGNGCSAGPLETGVALKSGFSHYRVGVGRQDITVDTRGLGMAGFAYKKQTITDIGPAVLQRQHARAFVIEENSSLASRKIVAIVVADIWTCTQAVKNAVIGLLGGRYGPSRFTAENVLIAGTHTHAGAGGYSDYYLYNYSIGGFNSAVLQRIVYGIFTAIVNATENLKAGRIFVNSGEVSECGANRSIGAYKCNVDANLADQTQWTDREMLLLKFVVDDDNRGKTSWIGAVNWYAIHPTSLGMHNQQVSGDNKGWAEEVLEKRIGNDFIAGFGNASAGDVSGNVTFDNVGNQRNTIPVGSPKKLTDLGFDIVRMKVLGQRQSDFAENLFNAAAQELIGPLDVRYRHVDMSNVPINGRPGERTWPAAIGISFGAGSSEDCTALATLGSLDVETGIIEGMNNGKMLEGGILAWIELGALVLTAPDACLALVAAILVGSPVLPVVLPAVIAALAFFKTPTAQSYIFGSLAGVFFPLEVKNWTDGDGNLWTWQIPLPIFLPADYVAGQGEKPIMFPVGLAKLSCTPPPGSNRQAFQADCPLVPHVVPVQLLKIGSVAIAGVPSEFTGMAGRRLKKTIGDAFGGTLSHVAISGYSNAYAGYVTTQEEYGAQHYEGASTLYGPNTLEAYKQSFEELIAAMIAGVPVEPGPPFKVPGVYPLGG